MWYFRLFSEAKISPDDIYCCLARLKGEFSTVMLLPGATLRPPSANEKMLIFQHWPLSIVLLITFSTDVQMSWFLLCWILHSKRFNWSDRTQILELCTRCSGIWKMVAITKAKTTPNVFVENLVHLEKPWTRPFLHLMGFLSAHGMAQKRELS